MVIYGIHVPKGLVRVVRVRISVFSRHRGTIILSSCEASSSGIKATVPNMPCCTQGVLVGPFHQRCHGFEVPRLNSRRYGTGPDTAVQTQRRHSSCQSRRYPESREWLVGKHPSGDLRFLRGCRCVGTRYESSSHAVFVGFNLLFFQD